MVELFAHLLETRKNLKYVKLLLFTAIHHFYLSCLYFTWFYLPIRWRWRTSTRTSLKITCPPLAVSCWRSWCTILVSWTTASITTAIRVFWTAPYSAYCTYRSCSSTLSTCCHSSWWTTELRWGSYWGRGVLKLVRLFRVRYVAWNN